MKEIIIEVPDRFGQELKPEKVNSEIKGELVRCKDCKNWIAGYITDQDDFIPSKCGKYQQMVGHSSDDFCSLAERRAEWDESER